MYEYWLINIETGVEKYAYGYTYSDACRRANINPDEWYISVCEYVD